MLRFTTMIFLLISSLSCTSISHSDLYYVGDIQKSESFLGKKTFIMNYAPWCEACKSVLKELVSLQPACLFFVVSSDNEKLDFLSKSIIQANSIFPRQAQELVKLSVYPALLEYSKFGNFIDVDYGADAILGKLRKSQCIP